MGDSLEDRQRKLQLAEEFTQLIKELREILKDVDEEPKAQTDGFIKRVQSALSVIIGLVALLTASGFIVVNAYLSKYTDAFGYNIVATQYIAAGIGVWLVAGLLLFVGFKITQFMVNRYSGTLTLGELIKPSYTIVFYPKFKWGKFRTIRVIGISPRTPFLLIAPLAIILGFWLYGRNLYERVPRFIGGGVPSSIIIVFKEATTASALGLSHDLEVETRTQPVQRLAELTDGILVWDEQAKTIAIVKDDTILGMLDHKPVFGFPVESTAEVTPSPEATAE